MAAEKDEPLSASTSSSSSSPINISGLHRPSITLPPRSSMETMFTGGTGFSPGPMTLVSSFFSETDPYSDCQSFSQLLAGAMTSPSAAVAGAAQRVNFREESSSEKKSGGSAGEEFGFQFQQSRPSGLVVAQPPMFTVPPGLSPACLLDSPGFFSSSQGPFGMSHQQALEQVSVLASQRHPQMHYQAEYPSSLSAPPAASLPQLSSLTANGSTCQQMPPLASDLKTMLKESTDFSYSDQRSQSSTITGDKPEDDGYNWRKYGQKQVKGSEFPRSYYKCTNPNCPVTKKVERSLEGHVTEIIYKGQHNHELPQPNKRAKSTAHLNGNTHSQVQTGNLNKTAYLSKKEQESSQATHISGSSDSEEVGDAETRVDERVDDEPDYKRSNTEVRVPEAAASHKTTTQPKIIVQTTSEVDLLDDGYRWRKYGQKLVKGNPNPRSYYKCTFPACNVRKLVERAPSDPKAVRTTYEGRHNHDVPAARNSSHNTASGNASQQRPNNVVADKHMNYGNNNQQPIAVLRLKEEDIT